MFLGKLLMTAAAGAALATSTLGVAQAGQIQNRFNRQQTRLNGGVASGQLTRGEYNRNESRLRYDERARNRDLRRNDGHLTESQQQNLNRRLNSNSRGIYFNKHNLRDQPGV